MTVFDGSRSFPSTEASPARVWEYWLAQKSNFDIDRQVADQVAHALPSIIEVAHADRAFLRAAVDHLAGAVGVTQYLDLGSGLPSLDPKRKNTHEMAQAHRPKSRVVYVDQDKVVMANARALLTSHPAGVCSYIEGNLEDYGSILDQAGSVLDLASPVAVLLLSVLHFVHNLDQARAIVRGYMDVLPAGSYLVIAHGASDIASTAAQGAAAWNKSVSPRITLRPAHEVTSLFDGLEVIGSGIGAANAWRAHQKADATDTTVRPVNLYGGVARKG